MKKKMIIREYFRRASAFLLSLVMAASLMGGSIVLADEIEDVEITIIENETGSTAYKLEDDSETEESDQGETDISTLAVSVDTADITIYGLDTWEEEFISIPDGFAQTYQLEVTGASSVTYSVISGDSVTVSSAGLISPVYETWYWSGSVGSTIESDTYDYITLDGEYGTSVIQITADSVTYTVSVEFVDYGEYYAEQIMEEYITENITDSMTTYEKVDTICAYIANNYDYDSNYSSAQGMILSGGGDCWSSTSMIVLMCEMIGLNAWSRNGNRDSGAGSGHVNALVEDPDTSGIYYEAEAGYTGTAPRSYSVTIRTSLFCYRTVTGGIEVYQYDGNEEDYSLLTVPSAIDGKTVVSIGEDFVNGEEWELVILPDTITNIDDYAFYECENLISIDLPAGLTSIGDYVFTGCSSLTAINVASGNTVYSSVDGVVYDAAQTTMLIYPAGKTDTSLSIPASVTNLSIELFYECTNLENIYVDSDNQVYASVDGIVYDKAKTTLMIYPAGRTDTTFTVPDGVISIGEGAFYKNQNIEKIIIPDSVITIEDKAFYWCESLNSVEFSEGLTSIGEYVFWLCYRMLYVSLPASLREIGFAAFAYTGLERVDFSEGLETIDDYAFRGTDLSSVVIPASVTSIGAYAFSSATISTNDSSAYDMHITFLGDVPELGTYVFNKLVAIIYYPCGSSTWTEEVMETYYGESSITWEAMHSAGDDAVILGATCEDEGSVTGTCTICGESFSQAISPTGHIYDCTLTAPATCVESSFNQYTCTVCGNLSNNFFGDDLGGSHSFVETDSGTVHSSICSVCGYGCSFDSASGTLTIFGDGAMDNTLSTYPIATTPWADYAEEVTNVIIEDGIVSVGSYAFKGFKNLVSVTMPENITSIGYYAFYNCRSLSSITIPDKVVYISSSAFCLCTSLTYVIIPDSVKSIGYYAFSSCTNLSSIIFEGDAPFSSTGAFYAFYYMTAVAYYPANNSTWIEDVISDYSGYLTWVSYEGTHPHLYTSEVTTAASCTEDGVMTYTCMFCDESYTEVIAATGHSYTNNICSSCGSLKSSSISDASVVLSSSSYTYDGTSKTPSAAVTINGTTLVSGTDYTVSYLNNTSVGTATVTITGTGNYTGTVTKTFTITAQRLSSSNVTLGYTGTTYTGSALTPSVTVSNAAGTTLTSGTDYTVSYSNNTSVGTAKVTVTGTGNYTGTITKTFTIETQSLSESNVTLEYESTTYTGSSLKPTVTVTNAAGTTLTKGTDYTASYSNNTSVGTAAVTITGMGNYTGTVTKTFTITAQSLSSSNVTLGYTSKTYTGSALTPSVTVKNAAGTTLTSGTDYTVSYSDNTEVGTATVTITGMGNYTGTVTKTFTITAASSSGSSSSSTTATSIANADITISAWFFEYTGSEIEPTVTVVYNGETLTEDTDYTITCSNNINVGYATIKITGIGNYKGYASYTYTIKAQTISSDNTSLSYRSCTYNGTTRKPTVTVENSAGTKLTSGTDYTVTYASGRKNAGTYKVTITGTGNYTGTITKTFTIKQKTISSTSSAAKVTLSKTSYTYTGSAKKPAPTVKITLNGSTKKLTKGTDYTVTYKNNTRAGTATVTITGKGNYKGTLKKTFTINKASQTLKATYSSSKTVKYSKVKSAKQTVKAITKVSGAKGTVTYTKSSGSKYLSVSKTTGKITVKKGTPKGTYKIKVKIKSAATTNYKSASKTVTITVKVK